MSDDKVAQDASDEFEDIDLEDILPEGPTDVCRKIRDDGTLVLYECKTGEIYFEGDSEAVEA